MMSYETIEYAVKDGVATITLNRPDAANTLSVKLGEELLDAAIAADIDPAVRAVILTGKGRFFCAGGDLKSFAAADEELSTVIKRATTNLHAAISRLNWMDAPVVTAINGVAAGGGMSLAICGDLAIATTETVFNMAYTAAGLAPDCSGSYFLPRLIGLRRAKELALTNRTLTAVEAMEWGLINYVVEPDELMDEALTLARHFAEGPTQSYGETKRLLLAGMTESLESHMESESRAIAKMAGTPDGAEGVSAFIEKREPSFKGS